MQISKNTRLHNVLSMMDELTMSAAKDKRKYTVIKYSKATGSFYATDGKVAARYVMTELDMSINEGIEMLDDGYYVYYPAIGSLSNVEFTETFPDVERVIINFSIENTFKLKIAEIPDPDGRIERQIHIIFFGICHRNNGNTLRHQIRKIHAQHGNNPCRIQRCEQNNAFPVARHESPHKPDAAKIRPAGNQDIERIHK